MDPDFVIHREFFIDSRRDNILEVYNFQPKQLGRGGYGVVYSGHQKGKTNATERAIKKIPKKSLKNQQALLNEISILKRLDHPTIIKLYETFQDDKNLFLVTDFCEGGQLFSRLEEKGNFSENDARTVFRQIMEAVAYCHQHHIAHRDLKPQNFLFLNKQSLNLKLIDFGLAYQWKDNMVKELQDKNDKKLIGTSYYMAPQILKGSHDQRCDLWSAGVILYILLTAAPPFDGQNDQQILEAVKKGVYNMNIPQLSLVSPQAKDLIQKLLKPADTRITLEQIWKHPWISVQLPQQNLGVNFSKLLGYGKYSKLKKLSALYIASRLSQREVSQLGEIFQRLDTDHNGYISLSQLRAALHNEGKTPSLAEMQNLLASIDTDKNGQINYVEFLASRVEQNVLFSQGNIQAAFKMIDKDGNGKVQRSELLALLESKALINEMREEQKYRMNVRYNYFNPRQQSLCLLTCHPLPLQTTPTSSTLIENNIREMNGKSIEQIMSACDRDGNGVIDFNQFKAAMM